MTGLLIATLGAAVLALLYGVTSRQPGLINDSLVLTAFALLLQIVRRGIYLRGSSASMKKAAEPADDVKKDAVKKTRKKKSKKSASGDEVSGVADFEVESADPAEAAIHANEPLPAMPTPEAPEPVLAKPDAANTGPEAKEPTIAQPAGPSEEELGISAVVDGYDTLSTTDVVKLLSALSLDQLTAIETYETSHQGRAKVLGRIEQLRRKAAFSQEN